MTLPKKLLIIFASATAVIFLLLNSLYLVANAKYWVSGSSVSQNPTAEETHMFPVIADKIKPKLGNKAVLVIDKIGVRAPIILGSSPDTKVIYKELEKGVVKYFDAPKPGEDGVSIIQGHSSAYPWYKGKYGSVFALLGHLKPGDTFYVEYSDGQRFTYRVKQSVVFKPFTKDARLTKIEGNSKPSLVLISCWPVGTNYQRIAVEAELVS